MAEGSDVDEAKAKREEDRAGDEPDDDERQLDFALGPVVPEREVEKEDRGDRTDDVGPKASVEGAKDVANPAVGFSLRPRDARCERRNPRGECHPPVSHPLWRRWHRERDLTSFGRGFASCRNSAIVEGWGFGDCP